MLKEYDDVKKKKKKKKKKSNQILIINMFDIIRKILFLLYQHNKIARKNYNNLIELLQ